MQLEQIFNEHRMTIVPLAICFCFGWLAGWVGHYFWTYFSKREKSQVPKAQ